MTRKVNLSYYATWSGVIIFILAVLFPPWHQIARGYIIGDHFYFLFTKPSNISTIDSAAWAILLGSIVLLTGAVNFLLKSNTT